MLEYNEHLAQRERKLWAAMKAAYGEDDELYAKLKEEWFLVVDRQFKNIVAHESPDFIEQMWSNSKDRVEHIKSVSNAMDDNVNDAA